MRVSKPAERRFVRGSICAFDPDVDDVGVGERARDGLPSEQGEFDNLKCFYERGLTCFYIAIRSSYPRDLLSTSSSTALSPFISRNPSAARAELAIWITSFAARGLLLGAKAVTVCEAPLVMYTSKPAEHRMHDDVVDASGKGTPSREPAHRRYQI